MNHKFIVKTRLFDGTWEDCWKDEDGNPMLFKEPQEAQSEIDDLISDVKDAVAAGDMAEEYDPKDYKIFMV